MTIDCSQESWRRKWWSRYPRRAVFMSVVAFVVVTSPYCGFADEPVKSEERWPTSTATDKLRTLVEKTASVSNVTGTLVITMADSWRPKPVVQQMNYFSMNSLRLTRIELLSTIRETGVMTNTAFAYIIDSASRQVHVKQDEHLAKLDSRSAERWLSIADVFAGLKEVTSDPKMEVFYVGHDLVGAHATEVFLIAKKLSVKRKVWLDVKDGLIRQAQAGSYIYELRDMKVNSGLSKDLFTVAANKEDVPTIADEQVFSWSAKTRALKFGNQPEAEPLTIFTAARAGNLEAVSGFLKTDPQLVNAKGEDGLAPLHQAAIGGHKDVVDLLLANKAEVDMKERDHLHATALWFAAVHGHTEVAKVLISKGAKVDAETTNGRTPLQMAAATGHKDFVELLLANGANVNAADKRGVKPLRFAVQQGHKEIAELLRQHGATE